MRHASHAAGYPRSGPTATQLVEFFERITSGRITHLSLGSFLESNGIAAAQSETSTDLPLVVPYAGGNTIAELLASGHYDSVAPYVADDIFPETRTDPATIHVRLVAGHRLSDITAVQDLIERSRLRPATAAELLAFGLCYPELQRECPIVALGNPYTVGNWRLALCLGGGVRLRSVTLEWLDHVWSCAWRFAAVA